MKRFPMPCILGLLCVCAAPLWADGLLLNADLSRASAEKGVPDSWVVNDAAQSVYTQVDDDGHSGSFSLQYKADEAVAAGRVYQECACQANTDYIITAALKSDGTLEPAVLVNVPGTEIRAASLLSDKSTTWKVFRARFNSGNATRLAVELFGDYGIVQTGAASLGRAALDDVQIYAVAEAPEELQKGFAFTPPGPNIALGKSYTISPQPNYGYCTDSGDAVQLTDGVYTVGYFWTQTSTVGWSNTVPVVITVDLQEDHPIAGVAYSAAAGVAGVSWPQAISVLVSNDKQVWTYVGDLVRLSTTYGAPASDKYGLHRFATADLEAHGRYVAFIVDCSPYCFVDEVEVYRGPEALLAQEPAGEKTEAPAEFFRRTRVVTAMAWRLSVDLSAARERVEQSALNADQKAALLAKADALQREIGELPPLVPADFTTVLPLNNLHERIYALNAAVLRSEGLPALSVWQRPKWDMLAPDDAPSAAELAQTPSLDVHAMRGEFRGATLNLTNSTDEMLQVGLSVTGLPGGPDPEYLTICDVLFTDTKDRTPIADALPQAEQYKSGARIEVPAGCSKQVWLSFHPEKLDAGAYGGQVMLESPDDKFATTSVPVALTVYGLDFPEQASCAIGGWDYTNGAGSYDVTPQNRDAFIELLRAHWVNTPWASSGVTPQKMTFDADGNLTNTPDFTQWDEWVARWPGALRYCVFWAVGNSFYDEKMGTDRFNRMVGDTVRVWMDHAREQGIDPATIAVLLVDEPHAAEQVETIIAWARAIRAADTGLLIWEDPTYDDPREADIEMFDLIDVMCPNLPMFMNSGQAIRDFYANQQAKGREWWFYSCSGPMKLLDPYAYVLGQFWWAMKYDAKGSHYWAFGDEANSKNSWNPYTLARAQFSPLYIDPTSVTTGKHMEAVREGAQDFETFVMLKAKVADLEARNATGAALDRAKALLQSGPDRVIEGMDAGTIPWNVEKDRTISEQVRVEMLKTLAELAGM